MAKIQGELLRGNIDTIILKCLFEGDKYGNEICKAVEERTLGQFEIKQPTLYSCLTRLENQGLVTCTWVNTNNGGRRKYFAMTSAGHEFFAQKQKDWEFSRTVVDKLISEQIFDLSTGEVPYRPKTDSAASTESAPVSVLPAAAPADTREGNAEETERGAAVADPGSVSPAIVAVDIVPADGQHAAVPCDATPAELEIAAAVIEAERAAEQESEPVATPARGDRESGEASRPYDRANGGTSYYDHLSEQTYTPPKRGAEYFRFEETEQEEEETEEEARVAAEILTRESGRVEREPARQDEANASAEAERTPRETLRRAEAPAYEPRTPEESQRHDDARSVLYSAEAGDAFDNLQNVSAQQNEQNEANRAVPRQIAADEEAETNHSDDYRTTLSALFATQTAEAAQDAQVSTQTPVVAKEKLANGLTIRRHSRDLTREYNEKFYVFGNRLRLSQSIVLAVVMLVETLCCYLAIGIGAQIKTDSWLYFAAAALAVAYPIFAAGAYFIKPLQIQRIDDEKKNYLLFKLILTLQAVVLIVCINILVDKNVLTDPNYLNRILLPIVLSTNIVLHGVIGQIMIKTKRFAVK